MVFELTTKQFQKEVLENDLPSVIDIYTLRCPKCKIIAPILEEAAVANNEKYSFFKLNASENMEIAKRYKVLGVPTLLFFRHGILVDKKTGVLSQEKIEKRLAKTVSYTTEMANKKEVKGFFKMPWS